MSKLLVCMVWLFFFSPISLLAQSQSTTGRKAPERDAQSIEILNRVVQAAGGSQALAAVRDITERGEITFYWGKGQKGPVTIEMVGGRRYRMEADLPQGPSVWITRDGTGWKKESDERVVGLSSENATPMGNFTYPIGQVVASLADPNTSVSFVGIESRKDHSVYRLRVTGRLGLLPTTSVISAISKDLIIDALSFDIVGVADRSFPVYEGGRPSDKAPYEVDFSDFHAVNQLRVPFLIDMTLMGQHAMDIRVTEVTLNSGVREEQFQPLR
jgi:hypothetical protein